MLYNCKVCVLIKALVLTRYELFSVLAPFLQLVNIVYLRRVLLATVKNECLVTTPSTEPYLQIIPGLII